MFSKILFKRKELLNYLLILIFLFYESCFFASSNTIATLFGYSIYFFLFVLYFTDFKSSLILFLTFTICAHGIGNFIENENVRNGFLNLRLLGSISFNMTFSLFYIFKSTFSTFYFNRYKGWYIFYFYLLILGLINLIVGRNYLDNFLKDLLLYTPILIYTIIIQRLTNEDKIQILRTSVILTFILLWLNYLFNNGLVYADQRSLPINAIYLFFILALYIFISNNYLKLLVSVSIFYFLYLGNLFVSAKFIIITTIGLIGIFIENKNKIWVYSILLILLFFLPLFISNSMLFNTKLIQFQELNEIDFLEKKSSLANLFCEFKEYSNTINSGNLSTIFGNGFGGTLSEKEGLLSPWVYSNGYAEVDANRNAFYKMHTAILEIIIKGGLVAILLLFFEMKFKQKFLLKIFYLLVLLLFFYTSKEGILLLFLLRDIEI